LSVIRISIRNLIRSPLRTGGTVVILAVSVGLSLIMLTVNGASANQLSSIGGEIGTDITVRPAGVFGMMGGGEPLDEESVAALSDIPHVVAVQKSTQTQYTGGALESAIEPGTLGMRGQPPGDEGVDGGGTVVTSSRGITVMGFDPATENPVLMGDASIEIVEGRYFTIDEIDADVVVVSQDLAEKNGLEIGFKIDIEGVSVEVIGLFDSGQVFGNNMLVMPIETVQRVFDLPGVTSVTVTVDYVDNVDGVEDAIREIFDEDTADIVTTANMYERINEPLVNASSTSQIGLVAAFAVAAVVILFSVTLMVRQRVKDIGILKAIGASNWHIGLTFSVETLAISLVAAVIGALITFPLAQSVADMLVDTSTTVTTGSMTTNGPVVGGGRLFSSGPFGGNVTSFAGLDVAVSPEVFLYALAIAVVLAITASIISSWYIARVKPAEVLRYE
jgi:putative ABC transport system permease protein